MGVKVVGRSVGNEVGELDGKGVVGELDGILDGRLDGSSDGSVVGMGVKLSLAVGISRFQQMQAKKIVTRRRGCLFIVSFSSTLVYLANDPSSLF